MGNQLARVDQDGLPVPVTRLAATSPVVAISPEKRELLKRTICKGATDDELELALAIAGRMGLDPFARQIAFIKRYDGREGRDVMTAQPTIDGARLLAQRSANYGGQLGPWWCGADGQWVEVWLDEGEPVAAKVGVINKNFSEPLYAVAKFSSYAAKKRDGKLTAIWAQMPDLMIAKCAEMLALRRAFPAEFSDFGGVDFGSAEDIGQMVTDAGQYIEVDGVVADSATGEIVAQDETKTQPTKPDAFKRLFAVATKRGFNEGQVHAMSFAAFEVLSLRDLDLAQISNLATWVETLPDDRLTAAIAKGEQLLAEYEAAQGDPDPVAGDEVPNDEPAVDLRRDRPAATDDVPDYSDHDPASPIPDFLERIRKAKTEQELNAVTQEMQAIGVWDAAVTPAVVAKRNELGLKAPKPTPARPVNDIVDQAPLVPDGEPGLDRHSN